MANALNRSTEKTSLLRAFFPTRPLQWLGVAAALAVLAGFGGALVAGIGLINLSAVPPHPDGWAHLLHFGMRRSVAWHANPRPPDEPLDNPSMVMRGAAQYAVVCENCHGAPGFGQSPVALSMRPEPPMIVDVAKRLSDKELFFIVANGVRYTGMPAWPVGNRPDEVWAVVAFLKAAGAMDRQSYVRLARGDAATWTSADAESAAKSEPVTGRGETLVASTPSIRPRPYLPGDPQTAFPSPEATLSPRTGFGNVPLGGEPMSACVSCHADHGQGRADGAFPNLTLQSPQYLYDALKAFASGQRQSGIMWPIAANLSDADMRALAVKLGTPPALPSLISASPAVDPARGAEIAAAGIAQNGASADGAGGSQGAPPRVERCSSCHVPGAYLSKVIPRLDGQYAAYLRMQLLAFRNGGRGDTGAYDPMVADAHNLSDADIAAIADFYGRRPPMAKTAKN